ncbi:MAG: 3',5'-nucleoside bisphosphate phosphatase [Lautropia sp.]
MTESSRADAAADPWRINVDLHCHSSVSDGTLAPREIVRRAHGNGVQLLALTDHDELGGLTDAADEAARLGLLFVPGVEVSVSWADETIHVVGLRVDPADPTLLDGLARIRAGRDSRAHEIGAALARAGIPGAYEGALKYVGNPRLISRSHFARFLVEAGACRDIREVFSTYLVQGKPGYVPHRWARLSEAVGWIRAAGGIAVLAHPARYRLDETGLWALVNEFREAGGQGIEVVSGSHTVADFGRFATWSRNFDLPASRGSDFHDPIESNYDLGRLPPLPDSLVPVWADWPELRELARA